MSASEKIRAEVLALPGVEAAPDRFGGLEFRLGRRDLGHLHGDSIADLPLPRPLRDELIAAGRARVHQWRPNSGWVTISLQSDDGVAEVIEQLRGAYGRARARSAAPGGDKPRLSADRCDLRGTIERRAARNARACHAALRISEWLPAPC